MPGSSTFGTAKFCDPPIYFWLFSAVTEVSNLSFLYNFCLGSSMPKQLFGPKLVGSGLGEHPKNFGTYYLFLKQLKLWTSNLVYSLGSCSSVALPEILNGLKFKQRSRDRHHTRLAIAIVDAFAKFKVCGFITKNDHVTHTTPLSDAIFTLRVGLAVVDPLKTLEVLSRLVR